MTIETNELTGLTNWSSTVAVDDSAGRHTLSRGDGADEWLLLQPLWDLVLANSRYTTSPLFPICVSNFFFFVCMVPYIVLDQYGLDHWAWALQYKLERDVRASWKQVRSCMTLILWNQFLFVLPISIAQCVYTENAVLPLKAPTLFEFVWQTYVSLIVFDALFYIWHVVHHRVPFLYKHIHSVHHRYSKVNIWVAQYDHPFELVSLGIVGTISPMLIGAHPLSGWSFMMLNDWVGAESHGGYDIPWLPTKCMPLYAAPIQHAMHHQRPLTNFQPYFTHIDRLMGSACPGMRAGGRRTKELEDWERKHLRKYTREEEDLIAKMT